MPGKHGPNRLSNYIQVHESCMADLLDQGFVVLDDCQFAFFPNTVVLEGKIDCLDEVTLAVSKQLGILQGLGATAMVQTRSFRYQAWVRGRHNIFRYDSAHGHRPYAHRHAYDTFGSGEETDIVRLANEEDIPTLTEVIHELQDWHQSNADRLGRLR